MRKYFVVRGALASLLLTFGILLASSAGAQGLKPAIEDALRAGDTAKAIDLLNKEILVDKAFHLNYYQLGEIYFARGNYSEARVQYGLALDKKSRHWESMYGLGMSYLRLNQIDSARKVFEDGIKKAGSSRAMFENGLGLVLMASQSYADADKAFRQAIVDDSTKAEYYINLGDANLKQGVPSLAAGSYEHAVKIDTASSEVYYHWAEACLDMKDYNCAIEKLAVVLKKDSTYAPAWMRAGGIYFKAGLSSKTRDDRAARFKEAIGSYKKYFDLSKAKADSTNVRAFFEIGMSFVNLYAFEDAAAYFDTVLNVIHYEPRDIYFYYGKALWGMRQYERADSALNKHLQWLATQPSDFQSTASNDEVYQLLGDCSFYKKPPDFATAVTYYQKSLDINAQQKRVLLNVALAYHNLKSFNQALQYYEKRIELGVDSASASIYKNAAYCLLNIAGNPDAGDDLGMSNGGSTTTVDSASATPPAGRNYYEDAAGYLEKYIQFAPMDTGAILRLGNTYLYNLTKCTEGVATFEKLLAVAPGNCIAKRSLGFAYFGENLCQKNYTKALSYFKDAYECTSKDGGCKDATLILWIAQSYHLRAAANSGDKTASKADFKAANEWYAKGMKCEPKNADFKKGFDETRFEF